MKNLNYKPARAFLNIILFLFIAVSVSKAGNINDRFSLTAPAGSQWNPDKQLLINLMVLLPGNVEGLADGLRMRYNVGYLKSIEDDALKMNNFSENISSYRENTELIVERRPLIELHDTVYLRLTNTTIRDYRLKLYAKAFESSNLLAYIEDAWLNRYQVIGLEGDTTNFNFSVTADPASKASNRFRIIFVGFGILPVHFTNISALPRQQDIEVKWTAENGMDCSRYDVERSVNGHDFSVTGTIDPNNRNSATYTWLDQDPVTGTSYYRIRSTGMSGEKEYSVVVKAVFGKAVTGISVYPNPVTNHVLNLVLLQMDKGVYNLQLVNSLGQVVMKQQLNHTGGTARRSVSVNDAVAEGRYTLVIHKPDNSRVQQALVIVQ